MMPPATHPIAPQSAVERLDALATTHSEWAAWLHVVREVIADLTCSGWENQPPRTVAGTGTSPHLAGAVLQPDGPAVAQLLDRLCGVARANGLTALAGPADRTPTTPIDEALAVFLATVNSGDTGLDLDQHALRAGATPEGWRALAYLLPMPYLQACARRWTANPPSTWSQGYCPVCGVWPAFAEVRGIQRVRHLRCGRCGCGWPMPVLSCTYCATTDHDALGTLIMEDKTARWSIDVCHSCLGYLKSLTTLQPTPPNEILVDDLDSVDLDLAAVERGFLRPQIHAVTLHASVDADRALPVELKGWWS